MADLGDAAVDGDLGDHLFLFGEDPTGITPDGRRAGVRYPHLSLRYEGESADGCV